MKNNEKKTLTAEQKTYVAFLAAGLFILAVIMFAYGRNRQKEGNVVEQNIELGQQNPVSGQVSKDAGVSVESEDIKGQEAMAETAKTKAAYKFYDGKTKLAWPVSGDVLLPYSMETTIYFETLDQYQCNPALFIQAESGTVVKACHEGEVVRSEEDARYGYVVTVDMGNGYKATYGQLGNDCKLKKGDVIKTGSLIGTVSEPTRYFTLEGSHLYFKMTKNGKEINPADYLES